MIYVLGIAGLLAWHHHRGAGGFTPDRGSPLAVAEQRLADAAQQLAAEKTQTQSLRDSLAESDRNLATVRTPVRRG